MRLMLSFFRAYRLQTTLMLLALILSGLAEGIGLSALLPLLNIALGEGGGQAAPVGEVSPTPEFERLVLQTLEQLQIAPTLGNMLLIIVGGVLFKSIFLLAAQRQVGYTAARVTRDLRLNLLRAILRSRWEYFLHQPVGRLTNALATESQRSSEAFINGATALTFLITALVYAGVAFALSWRASLVAVVAGVVVIGLSHFLVLVTRRAARRQTRLMTSLMANLTDTLQSVKPLKAMSREHLVDRVLAHDTRLLNKAQRRQVLSAAVLNSGQELMFTVFICLGVYVALRQYNMEIATVTVLVIGLGRAFSFFGKVQKQYQKLAQGESAYWALLDTIAAAERAREENTGGVAPQFRDSLRFDNVAFSYDDRHPVFRGLNLSIEAGSLTTLVGPSGSGKTTIIDLAIGLLQPQEGAVLLDGTPLQQIDMQAWRGLIGYVPQETLLLHDSILHNVTLGDPALGEPEAERALRDAGAWEFVSQLRDGLHTIVGERGGKLSGGQRQRIIIARALINRPSLLILDEATSALDPDSEKAVRQTMETLKGQFTLLAISHNRAMVQAADRVYQLSPDGAELLQGDALSDLAK
ncbi:MAG: ABC transporter ATP-binding protein [Halioglobus sp.]|nr:ABC transporter ATP-binding protein [Halioglobus sp.]